MVPKLWLSLEFYSILPSIVILLLSCQLIKSACGEHRKLRKIILQHSVLWRHNESKDTYSIIVSTPSVFITRLLVSPGCADLNTSSRNVKGRAYFSRFINCTFFVITPAIIFMIKTQSIINSTETYGNYDIAEYLKVKLHSKSTCPIGLFLCSSSGCTQ